MAECESCHEAVPDGLIHVPAERVGGEVLREPTIDSPGEYAPPPDPGCNVVTVEQIHDYLAAHCANCGGVLDPGMAHMPMEPGICSLGATLPLEHSDTATLIIPPWVG